MSIVYNDDLYGEGIESNTSSLITRTAEASILNEDTLGCVLNELKKISFQLSLITGATPTNADAEEF